jgi:hypothetical protein
MVWIHGSANAAGTSATYDVARNYAEHDGIVVVTVNYRLGVLGWFRYPALSEADQATPEEQSGNFGGNGRSSVSMPRSWLVCTFWRVRLRGRRLRSRRQFSDVFFAPKKRTLELAWACPQWA